MQISLLHQLLSFAGALFILIAYVGHQMKWMAARSIAYNALNAIGSGLLGYVALSPFQVGFVVLEFVWAGVSIFALSRILRRDEA